MAEPMTPARLAALLDQHMQIVAYLGETNALPLGARWRQIMGDSYADDCIGPVCLHEGAHQLLDDGKPDVRGQYDCCPHPVIECHNEALAAWLVTLLNGFPELAAEIRRARAAEAELPVDADAIRADLARYESALGEQVDDCAEDREATAWIALALANTVVDKVPALLAALAQLSSELYANEGSRKLREENDRLRDQLAAKEA